jgi:hypothetical protein
VDPEIEILKGQVFILDFKDFRERIAPGQKVQEGVVSRMKT